MDWLTNIVVSVLGAAVWSALLLAIKFGYERSGVLAGDWYQVTYYANDPSMEGVPWSVELVRVRHHRATVSGSMWRVHNPYPNRKWSFMGRYEDGNFHGAYWAIKGGEGGNGSLHLSRVSSSDLRGKFVESKVVQTGANMSIKYLEAPLEWVKVGSSDEARVLPWLELAEVGTLAPQLPARVLRILRQRLSSYSVIHGEETDRRRRRLLEGLSYGGALVDLTGPLAMEAEKKRRGNVDSLPPLSPGQPLIIEQPGSHQSAADRFDDE